MDFKIENLSFGIVLGFKLARLEFIWGSDFGFAQKEFENAKNELYSLIAYNNIIPNENSYQSFSSSILNFYRRANPEIFYSILIGICIQRSLLIGASKSESANKEIDSLAKSILKAIPNDILRDKENFFEFIKSKKVPNFELPDIIQEIDSYLKKTVQQAKQDTYVPGESGYVFISYSSRNQSYAEATRNLLKQEQINSWMAPYDIPAGSKYAYVINDAIQNCSCVLLLLTEEAQASEFVEREIERAVSYKKSIISMHLDESKLNSGFSYFLGSEQIVPVKSIDKTSDDIKKILNGIRAFCTNNLTYDDYNREKTNLRVRYCEFISNIHTSDYAEAEQFFIEGNNIDVEGGIFDLCNRVLNSSQIDVSGKKEFEETLMVSKIIYYLARKLKYEDICMKFSRVTRDKYASALSDIKDYMMKELNTLTGEFIDLLFQSLGSASNNRSYWERFLKEIFIWLRIFSEQA